MKRILSIILSAAALVQLSGCGYVLDDISPKSKISTDKVGESDLSKLTNGVLYTMETYANAAWFDGDRKAEAFRNGPGGAALQDVLLMTPSSTDVLSLWQRHFTTLRQVNGLLSSASSSSSAAAQNALKTAYFCRAYVYFGLVTRWGTAPILRQSTTEETPLSSAADVWAFIKEDLQNALNCSGTGSGMFYVSDAAIYAMMAKACLWTGENDKAAEYADKVISDASFALAKTSEDLASTWVNGTSSKEIVFALANKRTESQITLFTSVNDTDGSWSYSMPDDLRSTGKTPLFGDTAIKTNDIRKAVTISDLDPNRILKFPNGNETQNQFVANGDATQSPLVLIRIAEMYLVKAEALGNTAAGHAALKTFMESRYETVSLPATMTDREWSDMLLDEYFREFYAEGHRWYDVKRLGRQDVYATLNGRDYLLLWPIPQHEIDLLKNKSAYPQNPGYTSTL